jgi:xanthine dehydrogenase accessory factor
MTGDLLARAAELQRRGEAFALATVVRCERPTSAKPGARALIRPDGSVSGWVGGACAEPVVIREALAALRDGEPRLVAVVGERPRGPGRTEGVREYPMTCHSGGTLEIYVEPHLPRPLLVLVGHGPIVETLAALGAAAGHAVVVQGAETAPDALGGLALTAHAAVVVATHADSDEAVLEQVLGTEVGYVSLVASRRRAAAIVERLGRRGVSPERLGRLKAPAGLDIGAVTPEEIAVSILAEIVSQRRSHKVGTVEAAPDPASTAGGDVMTDPVCGMRVEVATARYRSDDVSGRSVYFCCRHCQETFERDPEPHRARLDG